MSYRFLILVVALATVLAGCTTPGAEVDDDTTNDPNLPGDGNVETPTDDETPVDETPVECPETEAPDATPGEKLGYPEVVFTVSEPGQENPCFAFVGPESVSAGWTVLTLQNNGMAPHILSLMRLAEGKTFADFVASAGGAPPEWVVPVGGVGFATPFSSGSVLVDLEPGTYVMACFVGGHHEHGMVRPLVVTEGEERPAPEPAFTIELQDYTYVIPENITAGTHVVRVFNNGTEPHEAPLVKLSENTTIQQFAQAVAAAEAGNAQGPPPGAGVGGVNALAPGLSGYAILDLTEGEYGFICVLPSHAHEGKLHLQLGMMAQFSVGPAPETTA